MYHLEDRLLKLIATILKLKIVWIWYKNEIKTTYQ